MKTCRLLCIAQAATTEIAGNTYHKTLKMALPISTIGNNVRQADVGLQTSAPFGWATAANGRNEPLVTVPSLKLFAVAVTHTLQGAILPGPWPDLPLPRCGIPNAAVRPARSL